eukprot:Sdes_comp21224_c0_seq1m19880
MSGIKHLEATRSPNDTFALSNCVVSHPGEFESWVKYVMLFKDKNEYVFSLKEDKQVQPGSLGFSNQQRRWAEVSLRENIAVKPYDPTSDGKDIYISTLKLEVDFFSKARSSATEKFDSVEMSQRFVKNFSGQVFTVGQLIILEFKTYNLSVKVLQVSSLDFESFQEECCVQQATSGNEKPKSGTMNCKLRGVLLEQTTILWVKSESSILNLVGNAKGAHRPNIMNPDWNFESMGIGGLDQEFSNIFRRAFASRIFPPD